MCWKCRSHVRQNVGRHWAFPVADRLPEVFGDFEVSWSAKSGRSLLPTRLGDLAEVLRQIELDLLQQVPGFGGDGHAVAALQGDRLLFLAGKEELAAMSAASKAPVLIVGAARSMTLAEARRTDHRPLPVVPPAPPLPPACGSGFFSIPVPSPSH